MGYRTPADIKEELQAYPRRVLILTTVVCESRAIRAHLTNPERLIGDNGALYEYGRFSDPAGDWLVVHAITPQGNSDAGIVATKAFQEFGSFNAAMFVGVAGSLKEDILIGSVVVGDYVYNGHSAKVGDNETFVRPHGLVPARELLTAAQGLIIDDNWWDLLRAPAGMDMPKKEVYPCNFPPSAVIKGIVSGEEVVSGDKSQRFSLLSEHFNDCGAVEMEGWGVMNAAHYENASAIIVRGISDMCAGKGHATDILLQPIAAAHAAAFAFSILSFRSKVPLPESPVLDDETKKSETPHAAKAQSHEEHRVEFVFNFEGTKGEWGKHKIDMVVDRLKQVINDEKLTLVRVDTGSVRIVMSVREADIITMDLARLQEAVSDIGVTLLGAARMEVVDEAVKAKNALAAASVDLLAWEKTLPNGKWMERPERESIEVHFQCKYSSTVLLGEPGSGKSSLLSKIAADLLNNGATVFALKADFLPNDIQTEIDLQRELQLPAQPSDLILSLATLQPVYVLIDQLDALASQLDLRSGRLNVLLNIIRRVGGVSNVHVLLSARAFEFHHDVRLRAIEAEAVELALPPWYEVKEQLNKVGINPDGWPDNARDVVRIPQSLKTFITLVNSGRTEPFSTYQAMLEQLWSDRIASANDSECLIQLASDIAGQMAEEETLWLAAARFDDRFNLLKRLEALGFIVRSENSLSVAFSHQTIFDYVLARTFVRNTGLLSTYVLERQDSLFVRAKVWSALNYLREAEASSYEREILAIWKTKDLRRHLRFLLIEFLGQVSQPRELEKTCMGEVLNLAELRVFGLKAIYNNSGWFKHFALTAIRDAMSGTDSEADQARQILARNWKTDSKLVTLLIKECWLSHMERDSYSWMVVHECPDWTEEVEAIAVTVLNRTPISVWHVDHTAMTLAIEQPDVALRLVRAKLDFLLAEAKGRSEQLLVSMDSADNEKIERRISQDRAKEFQSILESMEWNDLPTLAEAVPATFLQYLWSWYTEVFSEILSCKHKDNDEYIYPGRYFLEIEPSTSETQSAIGEEPVMSALQISVEELAKHKTEDFLKWANENSKSDMLVVQQLIARGYEVVSDQLAQNALEWILQDQRRFQLGTARGHRSATINLVRASAPHWLPEEIDRFQESVSNYHPKVPDYLKEPGQRKVFNDIVRATKKDILQAIGVERLKPENRDLITTEQRALGDRHDYSIGKVQGGYIGSPMESAAMIKAKDSHILKIFHEVPDNTKWDHPKDWMRGGNIQLSRAFAEFARTDPERAIRLIDQFQPLLQERAAGYALEALADDSSNDSRVIEAFLDLHDRGFKAEDFRASVVRAIEKIACRKGCISEEVTGRLVDWLLITPVPVEEEGEDEEAELSTISGDEDVREGSIVWGHGGISVLPGGNYIILSALASILLNRGEVGRDRYLKILEDHLLREHDSNIWKALLYRLENAGGSTPQKVSAFIRKLFDRFPEIIATQEAVMFLAHAQRWDDQLVLDLISDWNNSDRIFLQRAYGELVGLIATEKAKDNWVHVRDEIISSGADDVKIGLAHAAVNMWSEERLRKSSGETLVALLQDASKELVATVMDVFRITYELVPDATTVKLLRGLANPSTDLSASPSDFVVERLQGLLPYEAELIATIAEKLVAAWRDELGDIRTGKAAVAPQLTDLALTLHRMGGVLRQTGVALFESMIEMDACGARETLVEIDGRFSLPRPGIRPRLKRRRKSRYQRR